MTALVTLLLLSSKPVEVSLEDCPGLDGAEVERIAAIELGSAPPTPEPVRARVSCAGGATEIRVDDPVTRKSLVRGIELQRLAAKAKARTLALAIAELVSASWSELLLNPAPKVEPVGPVPSPEVKQSVREALPPPAPTGVLRVEAFGAGRGLFSTPAVQWGGGVRVLWAPRSRLGGLFDLGGEHAQTRDAVGRLSLDTGSVSANAVLLFGDRLQAHVGIGGRLGVGRIVGVPTDAAVTRGGTLAGAFGGPQLVAGLAVTFGHFVLSLAAEAGWALLRLRGTVDGSRGLGVDGAWAGAQLGLGWLR